MLYATLLMIDPMSFSATMIGGLLYKQVDSHLDVSFRFEKRMIRGPTKMNTPLLPGAGGDAGEGYGS